MYGSPDLSRLYFGSGGGGGGTEHNMGDNTLFGGHGARGAGIIYFAAADLTLNGLLDASGANGQNAQIGNNNADPGGGGGGAGGSIFVQAGTVNSDLQTPTVSGGGGGLGRFNNAWSPGRNGGAGSAGYIRFDVGPTVDTSGWMFDAYSETLDLSIEPGDTVSLHPATFNDLGTLDTHTATIDWGDGSAVQSGVVSESTFGPPGASAGAHGTIAGSHVYAQPGQYTVTVSVADDDGEAASDQFTVTVNASTPTVTDIPLDRGSGDFVGGTGDSDLIRVHVSLSEAISGAVESDFDAYTDHLNSGGADVPFDLPSLGLTLVGFEQIERVLDEAGFVGVYVNPVVGTNSSQTLVGDEGADLLVGYGGNDTLIGGGGNDILVGGSGNDLLEGGEGDDRYLFSGSSNGFDTFVAGEGNDQAIATEAGTVIGVNGYTNGVEEFIGVGDTQIVDTNSSHTLDFSSTVLESIAEIDAGGGNDTVTASAVSSASYRGGGGNDTLIALDANVTWLFNGSGNGFDSFSNGAGTSTASAESDGTVIGVNGLDNGVDVIDGSGYAEIQIRDTNSSRILDFSTTALLDISEVDAGGGNDTVTASGISDASYRGGSGNDTLIALDADVIWLFSGSGNGFDKFTNGDGSTSAVAEADGTTIGVNGFANGVDAMDASGHTNVVIRDTNSSRTLDFGQTALLGIAEVNAAGGNDTIVASNLSAGNYRGGFGNDSLTASSQDVIWLYSGTDNGFDSFVNGTGQSKILAEEMETSIGLNAYSNGADIIEGQGDTVLIDSNSSHALDFSQTELIGVQGVIGGGGNDVVTASDQDLMIVEAGGGNDTLIALGADVTWIYQGTGNGFDLLFNGSGTSRVEAVAGGTVIGVNGYDDGVDEFSGVGDTVVRDTNSSRLLNFRNTLLTGIQEIDASGGNDTIVTSSLGGGSYRGGAGNDTFVVSSSNMTTEIILLDSDGVGDDRIDLTEFGFDATTGFDDLELAEANGDTLIELPDQVRIRLVDIAMASLTEDDFLF